MLPITLFKIMVSDLTKRPLTPNTTQSTTLQNKGVMRKTKSDLCLACWLIFLLINIKKNHKFKVEMNQNKTEIAI